MQEQVAAGGKRGENVVFHAAPTRWRYRPGQLGYCGGGGHKQG